MRNLKIVSVIVLTFLFICGTIGTVYARDLRIHNQTKYAIKRIYVYPYGRSYSSGQQNSHTIPSGKNFALGEIPISRNNRYWNIKLVFSNGKSFEWKKQNLYERNDMTVYSSGSRIYADWD